MAHTPCTNAERLSDEARRRLLDIAQASINAGLISGRPVTITASKEPPELREIRASFVTLNQSGQLRGCIGTLCAHRELAVDVAENAFSAAFKDPRFTALEKAECHALDLKISVLSPPEPLLFDDQQDLFEKLHPGTDGLVISYQDRQATFLPAVWDSLPKPETF